MAPTNESASEAGSSPSAPMLRVVSSDATPEEIAALVAVFASLGGDQVPPKRRRPEWNAPARMARPNVSHGPGGWRASALPR